MTQVTVNLEFEGATKQAVLPQENYFARLRIEAVKLFDIDITEYDIVYEGQSVFAGGEYPYTPEEGETLQVVKKGTGVMAMMDGMKSAVREKMETLQSEEFRDELKEVVATVIQTTAGALNATLNPLRDVKDETAEMAVNHINTILKAFLLDRYAIKPKHVKKAGRKAAEFVEQVMKRDGCCDGDCDCYSGESSQLLEEEEKVQRRASFEGEHTGEMDRTRSIHDDEDS